jgi:hypothetical protein
MLKQLIQSSLVKLGYQLISKYRYGSVVIVYGNKSIFRYLITR